MNVSACFSSCRAWRFMWSTNTSAVLKFYPAAGGKFYVFFKKSAFHRSDCKTQKRNLKRTIESKPVNDCLRNLAYIIKIQQSLDQNIFLFDSKAAWYSIGVKVPSTSSLSVYTNVLAHNLNDIRNWASLIGLLFKDMLVFASSLFNLLLRWVEKVGKFDLLFPSAFSDEF